MHGPGWRRNAPSTLASWGQPEAATRMGPIGGMRSGGSRPSGASSARATARALVGYTDTSCLGNPSFMIRRGPEVSMNSRTDAATGEVEVALDGHANVGEGPRG